jgi:predicted nucleotidyltransferase
MEIKGPGADPRLDRMLHELREGLGERLSSVVLYGSAARGDYHERTSDLNLLLVLSDVSPATLELLGRAVAHWERQGQPVPRLFTPELIADSADVFPIEFLDIGRERIVLHGADPFATLEVHPQHLRLQCERELREKMMRLREGYVEVQARPRQLERLLTDSYTTFLALFRGCLRLLGPDVPLHNDDVAAAFCERTGLDRKPFEEVGRLKRGEAAAGDLRELFARYYGELTRAVALVNRLPPGSPEAPGRV